MGLIYMRISPSGGIYIGQTNFLEEERWKKHISEAYNKNGYNYNTLLNKAIRKYGDDNFQKIILEDNIPENLLNEREIFWIKEYQSFYKDSPNGYNMTRGGDGHSLLEISSKELINLWNSGLSIIDIAEHFNCERQAIHARLLKLGYTSKDLCSRRQQIAVSHRIINHYNKDAIMSQWALGQSIAQIAKKEQYDSHSIGRLLKQWGITKEEISARQQINAIKTTKKIILQFDKQGNFIQEWESISEAARQLKLQGANICKVLKGERKTSGNFIFKYKENN